jgi:hypothetical protein
MPTPTIPKGNDYFDATLYTQNGTSTNVVTNAGGFQPDLVWVKSRSNATWNNLVDSVRGLSSVLFSNSTNAQDPAPILSSFNSNGFTLNLGDSGTNSVSGRTQVGWQWKAGGAAVTNTAGTITSQVSANTTSGFSVVTYTGNGTGGATIGHGLGVAPSMIILKRRNGTSNWTVGHSSLPSWAYYLVLNLFDGQGNNNVVWNSTAPTSSVFTVGTGADQNGNGNTIVAYCFSEVAGYSKISSYTGNGSSDGPFVYCGFRPKFIIWKNAGPSANNWKIQDTSRSPTNAAFQPLSPDNADAESSNTVASVDFLSNGFKIRGTAADINQSGQPIIFMAIAENPFKYANAR